MACTIRTQVTISDNGKALTKHFIKFCKNKLDIQNMPSQITIFKHRDEDEGMTTGGYDPETTNITVLGGSRLLLDVLRSIAHELTHHKQNERGDLLEQVSMYETDLDTPYENEAYERSGNLVKEWTRMVKEEYPEIYSLYVQ